ncbi:TetR/AcrR family transcriptional regulator [Dactylosporangium aurantiacum]|uniref:TetR/AcrR family transcriptional regulator n=1 Tax=Dactylosporangium aurantiacum TaxID=35754 RepID=A0A9Q9I9F4_9ACTN|nr:TetR/AcrR family transcriptional regulator [Dactylosporangium aurantiacum]MDG6106670.1 helix-turn-helix domain containing protein [Dactylosporangium aurantiacum]UWZ50826.1 TetR/AcrR family transcriptional regulator [Dactylosporangium aurantiacum]
MPSVKGQVSKSSARGQATRARIVRHAYALFCEFGLRATTMETIAERAGVAVQTVYFNFRTKDHLLQAVHEWTILGDDPTPPPLQQWHIDAMREPDAPSALRKIVAGVAAMLARVAPMIPVYHAVSQDPAGAVYQNSETRRRADMTALVDALSQKTPLAPDVRRDRAADLLFFLTGPECYRSLVISAGWAEPEWVRWVGDTLCRDLYDTTAPGHR